MSAPVKRAFRTRWTSPHRSPAFPKAYGKQNRRFPAAHRWAGLWRAFFPSTRRPPCAWRRNIFPVCLHTPALLTPAARCCCSLPCAPVSRRLTRSTAALRQHTRHTDARPGHTVPSHPLQNVGPYARGRRTRTVRARSTRVRHFAADRVCGCRSAHYVSTPFTCSCVCFTLVPSAAVFRFFVFDRTPAVHAPGFTVPPECLVFRIIIFFFFPFRVLISTAVAKQINGPIYYIIVVLLAHLSGARAPGRIFLLAFLWNFSVIDDVFCRLVIALHCDTVPRQT